MDTYLLVFILIGIVVIIYISFSTKRYVSRPSKDYASLLKELSLINERIQKITVQQSYMEPNNKFWKKQESEKLKLIKEKQFIIAQIANS